MKQVSKKRTYLISLALGAGYYFLFYAIDVVRLHMWLSPLWRIKDWDIMFIVIFSIIISLIFNHRVKSRLRDIVFMSVCAYINFLIILTLATIIGEMLLV